MGNIYITDRKYPESALTTEGKKFDELHYIDSRWFIDL